MALEEYVRIIKSKSWAHLDHVTSPTPSLDSKNSKIIRNERGECLPVGLEELLIIPIEAMVIIDAVEGNCQMIRVERSLA